MGVAPLFCTIVANNYLAYARAFARSLRKCHPEARVIVLIVDEPHPAIDYAHQPFEVVFADDLKIPAFRHVAFRYSVLELSTAVKAAFLLYLHRRAGAAAAVYFDPDILITGSLGPLVQRLADAEVVLTPHITQPIDDGLTPGERDFLRSGIFNLGFLGVSFNARTVPFLEWWHARLNHECLHAIDRGLFVDQKWMDFAPAFLTNVDVIREPGYNVAYWNLGQCRRLDDTSAGLTIDGAPVRFFHFSGLDIDHIETISRFQNRLTFRSRPDLAPIFVRYKELLQAERHDVLRQVPYAFSRFADGTSIPPLARKLLQSADPNAARWADPFDVTGSDSFFEWLRAAAPHASVPIARIFLKVWDERGDLQRTFPEPEGGSRADFAEWIVGHVDEHLVDGELLAPLVAAMRREASRPDRRLDVGRLERRVWSRLVEGRAPRASRLSADELAYLQEDTTKPSHAVCVPRLALLIHAMRGDLQTTYPDPAGADRTSFAEWFVTYGWYEYHLSPAFIAPVSKSLPRRQRLRTALWRSRRVRALLRRRGGDDRAGASQTTSDRVEPTTITTSGRTAARPAGPLGVNVVGWASAPTGIGEVCRGSIASLAESEVPHVVWDLARDGVDGPVRGRAGDPRWNGQPFEITLFHANADAIEDVARHIPRALGAGRFRIGYWFWELAHFPVRFAGACRTVDEIWAPSRFCLEAYRTLAPVDVRWVPPAVRFPEAADSDPAAWRAAARDAFLFYNAFDALSVPERKHPFGLLDAFALACRRSHRHLHLLLKTQHLDPRSALSRELRMRAHGLPVTIIARELARADVDKLTATCHAYVSLHRSEGLGLPLIEAMSLGKPVIATGYGGVTDFLSDETGWIVPHRLTPLRESHGPYPEGAVWADPDLDAAADLMCELASGAAERSPRISAARAFVTERYSVAAAARRFRHELSRIRGRVGDAAHVAEVAT